MNNHALILAAVVLSATLTAAWPQGYPPGVAASKMNVADGLTVKLFASEPEVRQPILVKCDDRGRVWTIQYLQYPNPAGLRRVKVDRWSRTVYDRVPEPPPKGPKGADRITICEDTDGDGKADRFKDFVGGLNLCTGLAFGHGGVFVMQAPYLLFYPDRDRDDVPDSDPEVLLSGFGMEDAQSLANHLTWGPDGWLYGLNGSTTTCNVRGIEFQQGVWRYHPLTKKFELFCEGGGNPFGLTFDADGRLFYSANAGLFWHAVQGGYFQKNFGKHGPLHNPYAYGWLSHVDYPGVSGGPTTGGTIYKGDTFPPHFRGAFLAGDFLRHTSSWWIVKPRGSTVAANFGGLTLDSRDTWFGPTDLCLGPDGSVYLSDFFDKRTAHPDPDADWDRSNGRLYKVEAKGTKPVLGLDLHKKSSRELVDLLTHANGWYADQARVLLAGRRDASILPSLRDLARQQDNPRHALQGLWALYVSGGFNDEIAMDLLRHPGEHVRAWTVRLLGDERRVSAPVAALLADLAAEEPSGVVRCQLAATAKRLPGKDGLPLVEQLLRRDLDATDPYIPWLLWWAVEDKAISDAERLIAFFTRPAERKSGLVRANLGRLMRRYAAEGKKVDYDACERLLAATPPAELSTMLAALDRGLSERTAVLAGVGNDNLFASAATPRNQPKATRPYEPMTDSLAGVLRQQWQANASDPLLTRLALRAGSTEAAKHVRTMLAEAQQATAARLAWLSIIEEFGTPADAAVALPLLKDKEGAVQMAALDAVARNVNPAAAQAILASYASMTPAARSRAREVLLSRPDSTKAFLDVVDQKRIAPADVPTEQVRLIALHEDRTLDDRVRKHWGNVKPGTPEEKLAVIRRYSNDLRAGSGDHGRGRELFKKHCATCHTLFGDGGKIGPDLTNVSRADQTFMLVSLVDPSAVIRSNFLQYAVVTNTGVVRTGLIAEQDAASVTLVNAENQRTRIPRNQIEELRELPTSLMPDNLLEKLSPQELRDLFRYVQGKGPGG